MLAEIVNFNAFLLVNPIELDKGSFKYTKDDKGKDVLISGKYQKKNITDKSSPAYWFNKINELVRFSKIDSEGDKKKDKSEGLLADYYKALTVAITYSDVKDLKEKHSSLIDEAKRIEDEMVLLDDELKSFNTNMKSLVELSKVFEKTKKPYIDLFIEVSDLKNKLSETPETEKMTEKEIKQAAKKALDSFLKVEMKVLLFLGIVSKQNMNILRIKQAEYMNLSSMKVEKEYEEKQKKLNRRKEIYLCFKK